MPEADKAALIGTAPESAAACVARDHVQAAETPALISAVHAALAGLGAPEPAAAEPFSTSVTEDHVVSIKDGRRFRSMEPSLSTLGMTADQYRAKRGLPADCPMVAPAYAEQRSALAEARSFGEGTSADGLPEPDEALAPPLVPRMGKLQHPTR